MRFLLLGIAAAGWWLMACNIAPPNGVQLSCDPTAAAACPDGQTCTRQQGGTLQQGCCLPDHTGIRALCWGNLGAGTDSRTE